MNPYTYTDYRKLLRDAIAARKSVTPEFTAAKLAEEANVQRSYLSNVLANRADLNADQLFVIAEQLGFAPDEIDYSLLLLEAQRCQVPKRKQVLIARREELRNEKTRSENSLGRAPVQVPEGAMIDYFSTPLCSITHVLMTIESFRKNPQSIKERLGVSETELRQALAILERCGLLRVTKKGYEVQPDSQHLSQANRLARVYASGFRLKAIEYQQRLGNDEDYFFTSSFSASAETRALIKAKFLELLKWLGPMVERSKSEDAFHLNFDLFRL